MSSPPCLLTMRFALLNALYASFCLMLAMFFGLDKHLKELGLDGSVGVIISGVGLGGLLTRPFVAPFLRSRRACLFNLCISGALLAVALVLYIPAKEVWSLLAVRMLNGVVYAGLFCSVVALSPYAFPASLAGRAFSLISISQLAPFIIVPPLMGWLSGVFGGYKYALAASSIPVLVVIPLSVWAFKDAVIEDARGSEAPVLASASTLLRSLFRLDIVALLAGCLAFYIPYSCEIYFTGRVSGFENSGVLISVAIAASIAIRLLIGWMFDGRLRWHLLMGSFLLHALAMLMLPYLESRIEFTVAYAFLGMAWGVSVPLLFSLMMELSKPETQGFNMNGAAEMLDLGYFAGPLLGDAIINKGGRGGYSIFCAATLLLGAGLVSVSFRRMRRGQGFLS